MLTSPGTEREVSEARPPRGIGLAQPENLTFGVLGMRHDRGTLGVEGHPVVQAWENPPEAGLHQTSRDQADHPWVVNPVVANRIQSTSSAAWVSHG